MLLILLYLFKYSDFYPVSVRNWQNDQPISPITKPPLPPKPVRTPSMKKYLRDIEVSGSGRGAHVVSGGEDDDADSSDSDDEDDDFVERNGKDLVASQLINVFLDINMLNFL